MTIRFNPFWSDDSRGHVRLPNPSPMAVLFGVGVAAAAVGGGYLLYESIYGSSDPNKPNKDPDKVLAGFVAPGATLDASPYVIDDVQQPIYLSRTEIGEGYARVPDLTVQLGDQTAVELAAFGMDANGDPSERDVTVAVTGGATQTWSGSAGKAIGALVTNVTGEFARAAYEYALAFISPDGEAWDSEQDVTIAKILTKIAPDLDWSQGLQPYTAADAAYTAWVAVLTIGNVAYQSLANKSAMA